MVYQVLKEIGMALYSLKAKRLLVLELTNAEV